MRTDIQANRIIAFERLQIFTNSLKHLERDNYEVDRKLYILTAENARLRAVSDLKGRWGGVGKDGHVGIKAPSSEVPWLAVQKKTLKAKEELLASILFKNGL